MRMSVGLFRCARIAAAVLVLLSPMLAEAGITGQSSRGYAFLGTDGPAGAANLVNPANVYGNINETTFTPSTSQQILGLAGGIAAGDGSNLDLALGLAAGTLPNIGGAGRVFSLSDAPGGANLIGPGNAPGAQTSASLTARAGFTNFNAIGPNTINSSFMILPTLPRFTQQANAVGSGVFLFLFQIDYTLDALGVAALMQPASLAFRVRNSNAPGFVCVDASYTYNRVVGAPGAEVVGASLGGQTLTSGLVALNPNANVLLNRTTTPTLAGVTPIAGTPGGAKLRVTGFIRIAGDPVDVEMTEFDALPTPEPSTFALAALGGLALIQTVRRRRSA